MNSRLSRAAAAAAGPLVIIMSTLVVLRDYLFRALLPLGDVLTLWLPTYCFLGRRLSAGHIPGWNPHVMAGLPFAADPQSGWINLPAMALFTALPCGTAIRVYLVVQPVLGGLGLYWFLRTEGTARAAATMGGLVLALAVASSQLATALPLSGALAWTAVMLGAAARFVRGQTLRPRLLWATLVAVAWGQAAASLLSEGSIIATAALVTCAVVTAFRSSDRAAKVGSWLWLFVLLVPVNLAYLLPRLMYLPRTTIGLGYERLDRLNSILSGEPLITSGFRGTSPAWPLDLSLRPGLYLGAIALVLAIAALWHRPSRALAVGFMGFGSVCYVISLGITARSARSWFRSARIFEPYLHAPARLGLAILLAIAILSGIGFEAWLGARSNRERLFMLTGGVLLWGGLPLILGAPAGALGSLGFVLAGAALAIVARFPRLAAVVPLVLAGELILNGWLPPSMVSDSDTASAEFNPQPPSIGALPDPTEDVQTYMLGGPIAQSIGADGARYVLVGAGGLQERDQPLGIGSLNEAIVLGAENAGGYNSVQLQRYWAFIRASQRNRVLYNRALFLDVPPLAVDLLQVRFVVAPVGTNNGDREIRRQDGWALHEVPSPSPRVSFIRSWVVVEGPDRALARILEPGFDPATTVVLERRPGLTPDRAGGVGPPAVTYRERGPQALSIQVVSESPGLLLIRNSFDPNWHARVDGHSAEVLVADSFLQAVAVPAGRHSVSLEYDDPWVGYGLLGSALTWLGLLAGAAIIAFRRKPSGDLGRQGTPSASHVAPRTECQWAGENS